MMISKPSRAGSIESNDIYITLHPSDSGIEVQLESKVMQQFGERIEALIRATLNEHGITSALVVARDSGALDYTIRSRVTTAISRSLKGEHYE